MVKTLKLSLKIDFNYAINSFVYSIKKIPILKNLITANLYEKEGFKTFVRILGIICTGLRLLVFRGIYFMIIFYISQLLGNNQSAAFIHLFFVFSIIGMFIHTTILATSRKKDISILLFQMDAKKFNLSHYLFTSLINFIMNTFFLFILLEELKIPIYFCPILSLFSLFSKTIGEAISIWYYKKNKQKLLTEKLYFLILILGLGISSFPLLDIYFQENIIILSTIITLILAIFSTIYMNQVNDYKLMYKRLSTENMNLANQNKDQSTRQLMVNIRKEDQKIKESKLRNKRGYDLFNTIFFERHKYILFRSSKLYATILGVIFIIAMVIIFEYPRYNQMIHIFLIKYISYIFFVMYFINRGAIVTQAMFFNCDHALLTYNFYKEPKVILNLFKKRLITLIKVNLVPAVVLAITVPIILALTGNIKVIDLVSLSMIIIFTCVFFSVHYLVIYYLLQPYSKDMKIKSPLYSLVSFLTYFGCYLLIHVHLDITMLCILVILFTIIYILISLRLVYRFAPTTFKIK